MNGRVRPWGHRGEQEEKSGGGGYLSPLTLVLRRALNTICSGLNSAAPLKRYVRTLILGTCECDLIWKTCLCKCNEGSWDEIVGQVGPQCNDKCSYKRKMEGDLTSTEEETEKERRSCEDRGRNWSDAATSQGTPGTTRGWRRQGAESPLEPLEGAQPCWQHDFRLLASRTVRE